MVDHFTSYSEMKLLLGDRGTSLRLDDQSITESAIEQALIHADQTIRFYTDRFYRAEALVGNAWVKDRATVLAVNYLSTRRGNKELFASQYARIIEQLELIGKDFWIPDAVPFATPSPSVRNQKVVATGSSMPLKIDGNNSTGGGYPGEDFGPTWVDNYW